MNTENQNQNNQPNYDFILQQNQPGQAVPGGKKPKNKILIGLLIGGGIFILGLIGLAIYASVSTNVQQTNNYTANTSEELALQFIESMRTKDYEAIIADQLSTELLFENDINQSILERLGNGMDFSACEFGSQDQETLELSYVCGMTATEEKRRLSLGFVETDGELKISSHKVEQL